LLGSLFYLYLLHIRTVSSMLFEDCRFQGCKTHSLVDTCQHFKVIATSSFGVEEFSFISTKIVTRGFSETSVILYQTVRHRISQNCCPYSYRYSLKSLTAVCSIINYTVNNSDLEYCRMIV